MLLRSRALASFAFILFGCSATAGDDVGVAPSTTSPTRDAEVTDTIDGALDTGTIVIDDGRAPETSPPTDARPLLLFGVGEEKLALCWKGEGKDCARVRDDERVRAQLKSIAPGMTVRWGGYQTESFGLGMTGYAARQASIGVFDDHAMLEPSWMIERAMMSGYAAFILAVPVSEPDKAAATILGHATWTADDASKNLDGWRDAIAAHPGFPAPAMIELGNEPWLQESGPDGFRGKPLAYRDKARAIGATVKSKIEAFGWPTRVAVVIDSWQGASFGAGGLGAWSTELLALAADPTVNVNGAPLLQTHAYALHNGNTYCPEPLSTSDASDVACVYALYAMLRSLEAKAPSAEIIVTEDNYYASSETAGYPRSGVYTTLAALLSFSAGAIAYTHYSNGDYGHQGEIFDLFVGDGTSAHTTPGPLLANEIAGLARILRGVRAGEVTFTTSGSIAIPTAGFAKMTGKRDAPSIYDFTIGKNGAVHVDVISRTVTFSPTK